jgi:glutathione S-transferase
MIQLCGLAISNYYNKVKFALLEKGVLFEECPVRTGGGEEMRCHSPLAKIPYISTEQGSLCESQAIVDWLEATHPTPALISSDPWRAAKTRELMVFMELHLELVVRQIYPHAFFNSPQPEAVLERVRKEVERGILAFKRLARFAPYVGGEEFTMADIAAYVHLPLVGMATKIAYGSDLLLEHGVDWKSYVKLIEQRPAAAKVSADRRAYIEAQGAKT